MTLLVPSSITKVQLRSVINLCLLVCNILVVLFLCGMFAAILFIFLIFSVVLSCGSYAIRYAFHSLWFPVRDFLKTNYVDNATETPWYVSANEDRFISRRKPNLSDKISSLPCKQYFTNLNLIWRKGTFWHPPVLLLFEPSSPLRQPGGDGLRVYGSCGTCQRSFSQVRHIHTRPWASWLRTSCALTFEGQPSQQELGERLIKVLPHSAFLKIKLKCKRVRFAFSRDLMNVFFYKYFTFLYSQN